MLRLSYTKLQLYGFCPWAYRLRYVEKVRPRFRPRLLLGANVHGVICEFLNRVKAGLAPGWAEMEEVFNTRWAEAAPLNDLENERLRLEALELIRGFWQANSSDFGRPLVLEGRFRIAVGNVEVEGIVDRVEDLGDGKVEVIDYKTGPAPGFNAAQDNLQLLIYSLACQQAWSLHPQLMSLYYLGDNVKASAAVGQAELDSARARVEGAGLTIAQAAYAPRTGQHCLGCDYLRACAFGQAWTAANPRVG